ncbi:MAG: cytochrome c biogenesis protein ResB [Bacteriovoracaceae bacterium]|nr:cytochrome c biogenesis protein ResB [Bacteriovoracaceae bacterium]
MQTFITASFKRMGRTLWKTLGHLKFAVLIILLFALCLAVGTILESNQGTDYANRFVYKSFPFMALQALIFLSILVATLQRLPWRKSLAGFYVLHLGLLTIISGSAVTYFFGVDGSMTLYPKVPTQKVDLGNEQLKIFPQSSVRSTMSSSITQGSLDLPYVVNPTLIDLDWSQIKVLDFYPFSDYAKEWKKSDSSSPIPSAEYQLQNSRFSETLTLSQHRDSDFQSSSTIGPLSVHFLPGQLFPCFTKSSSLGLLVWNLQTGECIALDTKNTSEISGNEGKKLMTIRSLALPMAFSPSESPLPWVQSKKENKIFWTTTEELPWRLFNKKLFESSPQLLLFGEGISYYNKNNSQWETQQLKTNSSWAELPWMGFKVKLNKLVFDQYPVNVPRPVKPVQENGALISGALRAIKLEYFDLEAGSRKEIWATNQSAVKFAHNGILWEATIAKEQKVLPFELRLSKFKMDNDPGTNNPASYESFVALREEENPGKHHVYMNHPLKHQQYTFYQASFFQTEDGYGSVLSVNYDPGRFWKYLGSLLLVLGSFWHFVLRKRIVWKA